jgi:hypothetical protein
LPVFVDCLCLQRKHLAAERKQTDYKVIARNVYEYAYEINIRNHKDTTVSMAVNEPIGGVIRRLRSERNNGRLVFSLRLGVRSVPAKTQRYEVRK